jgi:hypothetical protein
MYNFYRRNVHLIKAKVHLFLPTSAVFVAHIDQSDVVPREAEVVLGIPGRLRPRIISTFGTTRVVGRQPYAPAAFTRRLIFRG